MLSNFFREFHLYIERRTFTCSSTTNFLKVFIEKLFYWVDYKTTLCFEKFSIPALKVAFYIFGTKLPWSNDVVYLKNILFEILSAKGKTFFMYYSLNCFNRKLRAHEIYSIGNILYLTRSRKFLIEYYGYTKAIIYKIVFPYLFLIWHFLSSGDYQEKEKASRI